MAYLVLARKWRPQSWADVVGQEHVTATLQNAIKYNRLAHAYLFSGPRGVGKTSVARILAKALNCEADSVPDPCNACSNCVEIADGRSIDVFEIDGASNRGIDEVRNLRENIRYTPSKGKYKIYIIDEVHMLTTEAFNALLKTLEEPPSHVVFIFATTEPHKVPATIVSRCQRFDFRRISTHDIIQRLNQLCRDEKIEIDQEALMLIARKADGSLRDSQSILDQMVSYVGEKITAEHVIKGLGLIEQELFFDVTDVLISGDAAKGLALVDRIVSGGYDLEEFLVGLTDHLRNILVVRSVGSTGLVETSGVHKNRYQEVASSFREEDLLRLIRIVLDTTIALKRSANPRLPLETAIVKMIKLDQTVVIDDLLTRLAGLGNENKNPKPTATVNAEKNPPPNNPNPKKPEPKKPKEKNPPPAETEKKTLITIEEVQAQWEAIIDRVKHKKITVGSFLQEGVLLSIEENTIQIGFGLSNGFHIDAINRAQTIVREAFREILQADVTFCCVKQNIPPRETSPPSKEKALERLKTLGEKKPVIKKMMDDFDVEIVD